MWVRVEDVAKCVEDGNPIFLCIFLIPSGVGWSWDEVCTECAAVLITDHWRGECRQMR